MNQIPTKNSSFTLRMATPEDAGLVVSFMKKLGAFQKMIDEITASTDRIERLLRSKQGEAVFGVYDGEVVGFAYFHEKSSAFTGYFGLYIDAFLIDESIRGEGLGNIMMQFLSKTALDRGCEMLEWGCLDWNTPAVEFYQKFGSYCLDTMRIYRLSPEDLEATANQF